MEGISATILGAGTLILAAVVRSIIPSLERQFNSAIGKLLGESKFDRLLEWVAVAAYGAGEAALREFVDSLEDGLQKEDVVDTWEAFKDALVSLVADDSKEAIFGIANDDEIKSDLDDPNSRNRKNIINTLKYVL